MKKKIKDLTKKEREKICKKYQTNCDECPLVVDPICCIKDMLDFEVEIDE